MRKKHINIIVKRKSTVMVNLIGLLLLFQFFPAHAVENEWLSTLNHEKIKARILEPNTPILDYFGDQITVVYLTNLGLEKEGRNTNKTDIKWLLSQGYRVVVMDYKNNTRAISPGINQDIIAINDSIAAGSFCGMNNCSTYQSYVLFEGYRIARNVPYFIDDPTVYNKPDEYTIGDTLNMDIIYPANPKQPVPTILSFSYCNSHATFDKNKQVLVDANKNQRLNLSNTLAGFNDSFLEGAPARGMAWAIADHPKYCPWGGGKPEGGKNDAYKSYQTNPDAVQKVKSAIRTLRAEGAEYGLSEKIGIYGFSRGSTAGSLAIGDRTVIEFENAGFHQGITDDVQAAALGPGVFDYTQIYNVPDDGDSNMETRCPWVWGELEENRMLWQSMGAAFLVETSATAPVFFFYNQSDELYYQDQVACLKTKLDSLGVPNKSMVDYGMGHAVPQDSNSLTKLYDFFNHHLTK